KTTIPNEVLRRPCHGTEPSGEALRIRVQRQRAHLELLPEFSQRLAPPAVDYCHELESIRSQFAIKAREVGKLFHARTATLGHEIKQIQFARLVQQQELTICAPKGKVSRGARVAGLGS